MTVYTDSNTLPDHEMAALRHAAAETRSWLELKLKTGRCASGLILELARHSMQRVYNVYEIFDEIGRLEGTDTRPSITKQAEPFSRHPVLHGLWHKHHHQASFIARNLSNEMQRKGAMRSVLAPYFGRYVHEVANEIAYDMSIAAYERRAREHRMTGEWIVFEKQSDGNYYLTLGRHNESAEDLRMRVEAYREVDRRLTPPNTWSVSAASV